MGQVIANHEAQILKITKGKLSFSIYKYNKNVRERHLLSNNNFND